MGAAQHYTHVPGVAHWASIKQASALVREGDTHPPKEKENNCGSMVKVTETTALGLIPSKTHISHW